jgi:O-antigen/teichoic acid export membrane protein
VIIVVNLSVIVINLALNLALIPTYGALGAAIGTSTSLIVHNILKQAGVARLPGMRFLDPAYIRPYATIGLAAAVLIALRPFADDHNAVTFLVSLAVSAGVVGLNRDVLRLGETFPELSRVPGLRRFVQR